MLRVTSTVPSYLQLQNVGPQEREDAWANQYEAAHVAQFDVYYDGYGHRGGRAAAAALVPGLAQDVIERESRIRNALEAAATDFVARGLMRADQDLDAVLMVGTGGSDAWVSIVEDVPMLFVALEMLEEPERDLLLVLHELVHVVHVRALLPLLSSRPDVEHHVGMRVWLEGVAVAATRHLRPGHPDVDYLSAPDHRWIRACRAALPDLAAALVPTLTVADAEIAYSFCGATDEQRWPSRAGYWVGDQVVRELFDAGHDLPSLITWGPERVTQALRESSLLAPHLN